MTTSTDPFFYSHRSSFEFQRHGEAETDRKEKNSENNFVLYKYIYNYEICSKTWPRYISQKMLMMISCMSNSVCTSLTTKYNHRYASVVKTSSVEEDEEKKNIH
jgi:hypothetical protein